MVYLGLRKFHLTPENGLFYPGESSISTEKKVYLSWRKFYLTPRKGSIYPGESSISTEKKIYLSWIMFHLCEKSGLFSWEKPPFGPQPLHFIKEKIILIMEKHISPAV